MSAGPATETRRWLLLEPTSEVAAALAGSAGEHAWDQAHQLLSGEAGGASYLSMLTDQPGEAVRVEAVEPDLYSVRPKLEAALEERALRDCSDSCTSSTNDPELTICCGPSQRWPAPDAFAWHLGDDFSQLAAARAMVRVSAGSEPAVLIAHLDTGYDDGHMTTPSGFVVDGSLDFVVDNPPQPGGVDPVNDGFGKNPGHGTGTLGILAGDHVRVEGGFDDFLGGAHGAEVLEYRISNSVVHLNPWRMAAALGRAAEQGVDVVSVSMGGLPSGALRDAVNRSYESGTAVFAASGDFLKPPLLPVSTPKSLIYPARFHRVVAVCGVTAANKSYAKAHKTFGWLRGDIKSWSLRGSFGPPGPMQEALAAYAPNIAWARHGRGTASNLLDLDGAGTSSSTPQVAAAAALWLQQHRAALEADWRSWRKVEAVYRALFDSADMTTPNPQYSRRYFGQGILRAKDALERPPATDLTPRPPATIGFGWLELFASVGPFSDRTDPLSRVRQEMLRTEIAQLVHGSLELQKFLGARDVEDPLPGRELRRFLKKVARETQASETLVGVIKAFLAGD